jgi:polyisoprenyl-phosphate glycosyltransferase
MRTRADGSSAGSDPRERQRDLSIVIPVYRSAGCLDALIDAIDAALISESLQYEVILVNDCSPDESWAVIERICETHGKAIGIDLRRNFGQDSAILTGIRVATGRYIAIMDDDLQHDPKDLPRLIQALSPGYDVAYADFSKRRHKLWKRAGSWFNGKVAEWVLEKPRHIYLSPYKVLRWEVGELICDYHGADPYIDGLLLQVTSRITQIPVDHQPRYAGPSSYTLVKSIRVWARVAFSFSIKPLRLVTISGMALSVVGALLACGVILYRLLSPESFGPNTAGWASLAVGMLFFGGIQTTFLGILGEYSGRTYLRVNHRPQTAIRTIVGRGNSRSGYGRGSREDGAVVRSAALTHSYLATRPPEEERQEWRRA